MSLIGLRFTVELHVGIGLRLATEIRLAVGLRMAVAIGLPVAIGLHAASCAASWRFVKPELVSGARRGGPLFVFVAASRG